MAVVFRSHVLSPIPTSISTLNSKNHPSYTLLHFPRISNSTFPSDSFLQSTTVITNSKTFVPKSTTISCSQSQNDTPSRRRPEYIPNHIPDPNYVRIFDTTLRDGEQSPGASMTSKEKIDIARQLAKLGVDIIEAGFPAASKDDFEGVKMIAKEVGNAVDDDGYVPVICGLSRCNEKDISTAWEAVKYAKRPRIHTFIATSAIHMEYKLKKTKEQVIEIARNMVKFARSLGCNDVEFSPEDAGRSDREFLYQILGEVIKAGATTLNIPDTVGITMPSEFGGLIADIKANTPGIENVIISTHCQNDLGLSTANTIEGARAGARQLEVTVNGIAEEGLSSLEPLKEKASLELLRTIVENPTHLISWIRNNFVKGGGDLSQVEALKIIYSLQKRRMYGSALQVSEWLETAKHFELREHDYASRIDLIAKVRGVDAAEKYINKVPDSFRGELLYRTLLANCVHAVNRKKAEAVFEKMRKLGLPITIYGCNQMIILYRRFNRRNIADILLLMEEENLKPSRLTYRNLIALKSELKDTMGIEQLVEAMKSQGLQPDIHVLRIMASHFISEGLKDKALAILNEIEGGNFKKINGVRSALLPLYASLDMADDVSRIWTVCKLDPTMKECLAAIAAWGKLGKVEEAEAVFEMMLEKWKKLPSKVYADLLTVYVQNNKIAKGKEFVKRIGDIKGWIGPLIWDGLVRLYVGDSDVGKADSILSKAVELKTSGRVRPMFNTFLFVMEQYAKLGDIHNTEKWLFRMKQCGYVGRLRPYEILIQAYINAKTPAYGLRERMKAENIYPNKSFSLQLAQIESLQREVLLFKSKREEPLDLLA